MTKTYHFIGIGGIGMSALAKILLQKKMIVKGSDVKFNQQIVFFKKNKAKIFLSHKKDNISKKDIVVFSTAINKQKNVEYLQAKKFKLQMYHRSDLLNEIMDGYNKILITGSHGKTTTTSLMSYVFTKANLDPSFVIGGISKAHNTNAHLGKGKYFIAESDESDGSFLKTKASCAIVTNLDEEHLNYWKTFANLEKAYIKFFDLIDNKETLLWCKDCKNLDEISPKGISYGFSKKADAVCSNVKQKGFFTYFDIKYKNRIYKDIQLNMIGNHSVLNALSVFVLSLNLGLDENIIRDAFKMFLGTKRRVDKIGTHLKIDFLDDYAHHPNEIKATLNAIRSAEKERKIIAIFQPHRYSRLKDTIEGLKDAFKDVDELIITDIYSAGEEKDKIIDEKYLESFLKETTKFVKYVPDEYLNIYLKEHLEIYDLVVALGAGDISYKIREFFKEFSKNKRKIEVAILFGGRSNEHEVTISSTKNYLKLFDKNIFSLKYFKIKKDGKWLYSENDFLEYDYEYTLDISFFKMLKKLVDSDLVFPIFHGPLGEDGMIAGFLETLNLPYLGADYKSSSLSMDKAFCKNIAKINKIKIVDFLEINILDYKKNMKKIISKIIKKLGLDLCIKANSLGSSIGIFFSNDEKSLIEKIEKCFEYDDNIIIEKKVIANELNVSIIGNADIYVSKPFLLHTKNIFFDYEKKYLTKNTKIEKPDKISLKKEEEVKELARQLYQVLKLKGFARIDFFINENEEIYFNEINPTPGFASENSIFIKMLLLEMTNTQIIDRLIISSLNKNRLLKKLEKKR
ncbi:MAG: UDP-N-acetylmuramate--L-alanine ligase [Candidatus Anoxychlamydiales bacterium]|nr:UDP-N-acetylmuramate--L-alanine ligase [Candidatus Anoxychlamydiales bacterium]